MMNLSTMKITVVSDTRKKQAYIAWSISGMRRAEAGVINIKYVDTDMLRYYVFSNKNAQHFRGLLERCIGYMDVDMELFVNGKVENEWYLFEASELLEQMDEEGF